MRIRQVVFLVSVPALFLAGCDKMNGMTGLFNHFVSFLTWSIESLAAAFDNSYGLAIIGLTFIMRLVLMPMMVKQYIMQAIRKEKMKVLQPKIQAVKQKYTKDQIQDTPSLAKERDKEILALHKEYGVNPFATGCLPILIQLVVLIGVYYAIQSSPAIASHEFLWLQLGKPDFSLSLITGMVYVIQVFVNKDQGANENMPKYLSYIGFISPIMMFSICLTVPSALPLYWAMSCMFVIVQTIFAKKLFYYKKAKAVMRGQEA
ncbi:membrane protein insertase YidC [Ectobacillus sp. JY-23]|uniref:membrane protein insertase YidC n=1 Tax=Ectobacillus sp. JY-23 TaxID=2933872 RepID=UPI001FF0E49A|nr:membrane protein insertase YidC [Ectobacillus sp. JY-23]UOY91144.1 membrane protein insertase YidC [Ectobacillus sp. JY-23]